jgi:hypothetical protein
LNSCKLPDFECDLVKELEDERLPQEWAEKPPEVVSVPEPPHYSGLQVYLNGLLVQENVDYKQVEPGRIVFTKPIDVNKDQLTVSYTLSQDGNHKFVLNQYQRINNCEITLVE